MAWQVKHYHAVRLGKRVDLFPPELCGGREAVAHNKGRSTAVNAHLGITNQHCMFQGYCSVYGMGVCR